MRTQACSNGALGKPSHYGVAGRIRVHAIIGQSGLKAAGGVRQRAVVIDVNEMFARSIAAQPVIQCNYSRCRLQQRVPPEARRRSSVSLLKNPGSSEFQPSVMESPRNTTRRFDAGDSAALSCW